MATAPNSLVREGRARRQAGGGSNGKCERRKSLAETNPEAVALVKALSRKRPKGGQMSLRAESAAMAAQGYLHERERPFNHKSITSCAQPRR